MVNYAQHFNLRATPQSEKIHGSSQVPNSAGGYSFAIDDWQRLDRWLLLGADGGSYYASEKKLTRENAEAVMRCLATDGLRTVGRIIEISHEGRAPKNNPALFALAMCAGLGNGETKSYALSQLPRVARTGTMLFGFATYIQAFRGWGRGLRHGIGNWYLSQKPEDLAFQAVKYRQRDGWTHRDLLRLSHPKTPTPLEERFGWPVRKVLQWICKGEAEGIDEIPIIAGFRKVQEASSEKEVAAIVREYHLPLEAIPPEKMGPKVWEAALPFLGMTALLRNLGNLSKNGILVEGAWDVITQVAGRLTDEEQLKKGRIHPLSVLAALMTYQSGHGVRGSGAWEPVSDIRDALSESFYKAFKAVDPTGKRIVLALDVSGSMGMGALSGIPGITPRVGSAAMAMVTYKTEKQVVLVAFSHTMIPVDISRCQRLDDVCHTVSQIPMGATNCALPMLWALENKVQADAFVIYSDSESWIGEIHASQALRMYRERTGIPARAIAVGMVANEYTVFDPQDAGSLNVVGFDTAAPQIMSEFIAGRI